MQVLLIRHGSREHQGPDEKSSLSLQGKKEVAFQSDLLQRLSLAPSVFLTSHFIHAQDSAKILATQLQGGDAVKILSLCSLTPHSPVFEFESIVDEAQAMSIDWGSLDLVCIVGHEPRLSKLLTQLTGKRARPLSRKEIVCISAETLPQLLKGTGKLEFRLPSNDYQEKQLREKVRSKMTVSTFLAGFTFTALIQILKGEPSASQELGFLGSGVVFSLTAALVLFISSVYIFDRLGMPEGFWISEDRVKWNFWRGNIFLQDLRENGILYALMIWTWNWVFTPAVILSLLGFLGLLYDRGGFIILALGVFIIMAIMIYYHLIKPRLGVD